MTFCDVCLHLLLTVRAEAAHCESRTWEQRSCVEHHKSYSAFTKATTEGCCICKRLLQQGIEECIQGKETADFLIKACFTKPPDGKSTRETPKGTLSINLSLKEPCDRQGDCWLNLDLVPVMTHNDRLRSSECTETSNTGSFASLGLAERWLRTCRDEHTTCERPPQLPFRRWRPTRLIEIADESTRLRLCEGEAISDEIKYTTLSHCWGSVPGKVTLQLKNIDSWRDTIPHSALLKTFQDAIEVMARLDVKYIWIDCFCIIQDSESDWVQESSQMSNVYKYSYCNIASTAATDDTVGCFFDRDPAICLPVRFQLEDDRAVFPHKSARLIPEDELSEGKRGILEGLYDVHYGQTWFFGVRHAPLNDRAWVVQERLLSPRVLNFGHDQLYWECNELQASESYPHGMPAEPYASVQFKSWSPFNFLNQDYDSSISHQPRPPRRLMDAFSAWAYAVSAFTGAKLSRPEDKLVAISGIAREMQLLMQCRYLAGLWEVDLIRQLCWSALNMSSRPSIYRAPSWSWASVDGPIDHYHYIYDIIEHYHPLIEIMEAQVEPIGQDNIGQVKGGHLQVRGQLIELEIQHTDHVRYEGKQTVLVQGRRTAMQLQEDDEFQGFPATCYCMPVAVSLDERLDFNGIVLQLTEKSDVYRRVGFMDPGLGVELQREIFSSDPLLARLGKIEWEDGGNHGFIKNDSAERVFRIN